MYPINWNNFGWEDFKEWLKSLWKVKLLPKAVAFSDGIYNISTWVEESICPPSHTADPKPDRAVKTKTRKISR